MNQNTNISLFKDNFFASKIIAGAPDGALPFLLAKRLEEIGKNKTLLHVSSREENIYFLKEVLSWVVPDAEIFLFPAWDCLPYDRVSPSSEVLAQRASTLLKLLAPPSEKSRIVLTSVPAFLQRVPSRKFLSEMSGSITVGDTLDPQTLILKLEQSGYHRVDTVREQGEYAVRGGILDLFSADTEEPQRIDFFDNKVEEIRFFDPITQRSLGASDSLIFGAASELFLDKDSLNRFRTGWVDQFGSNAMEDSLFQNVMEKRIFAGIEHYLPLFFDDHTNHMESLLDYFSHPFISFDRDAEGSFSSRLEMIADHFKERLSSGEDESSIYRALPPYRLYLGKEALAALLSKENTVIFTPFAPVNGQQIDAGYRAMSPFFKKEKEGREQIFQLFKQFFLEWSQKQKKVYMIASSRGVRERLSKLFSEISIPVVQLEKWSEREKNDSNILSLISLEIPNGFQSDGEVFLTEEDLFGEKLTRAPRKKRKDASFITQIGEIEEGDLVVHEEYGVGRYVGLETVKEERLIHDYLTISYEGDQRLLLPVENIDLLSRFGADPGNVALDRLGGVSWQARKAKMKNRLREMAGELIKTAAERSMKSAPVLEPAEALWDEFCGRFPFVETEDQSRAVLDVLQDLARGTPMDRLICGDVGFGKTEVALRAAFIVALSGYQVAVIVPTTLLSRQHYKGFLDRFEGLPVRIGQLSRLTPAKEAREIKKGLSEGTVDIVIGTHALLANSLSFNRLGLVIIDEEQHFGVGHKEKLKAISSNVHVLTLSATPLPRTLQLSLSGAREMSLIATPPIDRLAVRTFISPYDRLMIREALQRERMRGGQVFCVVPRLRDMEKMEERLKAAVPETRIARAHGQLLPKELEEIMQAFSDGEYDILLSTNIVESGLDMPSVNTIIIHHADRFGLGQLYQLRGRVGRGKNRGYAYLTWPQEQNLSKSSIRRLEIMETLDSLGAGFTLASHDLDMRGAGNLLGEEQSGHIREVGIELYQQMLAEAVTDLRQRNREKEDVDEKWTPQIMLGLPVLLPETYVPDLSSRLSLYRRIAALANEEEAEAMRIELGDRFGPLPPEAENLLEVVSLKRMCRQAGVERLEAGPKGLVLQFFQNRFSNPEKLLAWVQRKEKAGVRIRPDHKLALVGELTNVKRIPRSRKILEILQKLSVKE
ncbi:transcription-repair coupling factor [Acetobacteraceae bacterium]|nr:transcription-repair coupling factor [Acetobacteraceae bacterium]